VRTIAHGQAQTGIFSVPAPARLFVIEEFEIRHFVFDITRPSPPRQGRPKPKPIQANQALAAICFRSPHLRQRILAQFYGALAKFYHTRSQRYPALCSAMKH
jgi:hypothetical protein